jgi:hypothetical protein
LHSEHWQAGSNEMSRPLLGKNLYAQDRVKPDVPWRPNGKVDKVYEEARVQQQQKEPEVVEETSATSKEFNLLADLIKPPTEEKDNFKLNLFPDQFAFSAPKEAKLADQNILVFDLSHGQNA